MMLQLRKECELMQQRAETAEGVLERERGVHRRELRRRAKELADMQDDLVQVTPPLSTFVSRFLSTIFVKSGFMHIVAMAATDWWCIKDCCTGT